MSSDVDSLRRQLRERGYLSHGLERWFALDPWSSRAFWLELVTVAIKAATLIGVFGALPMAAVMLVRNFPLTVIETLIVTMIYAASWVAVGFLFVVLIALVLKLRPELAIDTPRALLAISLGAAALLTGAIGVWWSRFDIAPGTVELAIGLALAIVFFLVATIVVSAALLSFSIYELHRVPAIHQKPRGVPMAVAAAVLLALLFLPAYAAQDRGSASAPPQVVTTPTTRRVALVAVDGLTFDIFSSRPELARGFASIAPVANVPAASTTERWATVGTGVPLELHGVHAVDGMRLRGGRHVLQSISRADLPLRAAAAIGLAERQPLPPTVRRRDYIWEIFGERGLASISVNWWTSETTRLGALDSIGQEPIFAAARGDALRVDAEASRRLLTSLERDRPQFATVYLPALDVVLNRLGLESSAQLARSVRALDGIASTVTAIRSRGYDVVLVGLPGDRQRGAGVLASTVALDTTRPRALDIIPTTCTLLGFPLSREMPGRPLTAAETDERIASYGPRKRETGATAVDAEYYESLKSLGYIQ